MAKSSKDQIFLEVERIKSSLIQMADEIYDFSEVSFQEYSSSKLLEDYLEKNDFQVERGIAGLPTAFRAVYKNGEGGPSIGLLCEYDALKKIGHGCGHHLQGPAIVGAANAVKTLFNEKPYTLVVYGTPGEETDGGKIDMLKEGCFQDIDVALMTHGGPATQTDVKSMALASYRVIFHGISSHAAIKPEAGRSALDSLLLSFNALEFLREHVKEDSRMHYTIESSPGASNVVHDKAVGIFDLRSYNSLYLDHIVERFENIVKGASLMTGTTYEIKRLTRYESKIPSDRINELLMKNASLAEAPTLRPVREKTGSTDFGNVTFEIPGACIRVAFVPEGTPSHSKEFVMAGKSETGHAAVIYAAKILAATAYDLIYNPEMVDEIKNDFTKLKEQMKTM